MWQETLWQYLRNESYELFEWAKCGDSSFSTVPTALWAVGAAALAHNLLSGLFRRSLFRRVPVWEILLQHLLFVWMVIYSLYFWTILVKILKIVVEYCYRDIVHPSSQFEFEPRGQKIMQQWIIWMCGVAPLAIYIHTRPKPQSPPVMIWITTNPWHRREMGPHGYYLNRPPSSIQSTTNLRQQVTTLRKSFSDTNVIIKETPKKKRHSKSV